MDIVVSDESLRATRHCEKGFSCLKGETAGLCEIDLCIDRRAYFVKCLDGVHCSYRLSFGNSFTCTCPTRREIYDKYNI